MTFTLTIHPLYQFKLMLPLHKKQPIDLQSKSTEWFLYNGNTANSRPHLFQILILTWLKTFLTTFPKFSLVRLISQKQLKNYQILDDESSYHISIPLYLSWFLLNKNTTHVTLSKRYSNQIFNNKDWIL